MGKETRRELLELEHKDLSCSAASILRICTDDSKSRPQRPKLDGNLLTSPVPKSQVLGRVKDFLGVISEANKTLQVNAKDKPEDYDIEVLTGNESKYIEMDLMLGIADLHTKEAVAAAEAAVAGYPAVNVPSCNSSAESGCSSEDDDDDDDDDDDNSDEDDDGNSNVNKQIGSPMTILDAESQGFGSSNARLQEKQKENGPPDKGFMSRQKKKRRKIIELP
ncbi:hypothetical protein Dimus_027557 [Dionaea muscipula]